MNTLGQRLKYRDTNPCWVKNTEEEIHFLVVVEESSPLLSKTLSGYWLRQDDGSIGRKQNN